MSEVLGTTTVVPETANYRLYYLRANMNWVKDDEEPGGGGATLSKELFSLVKDDIIISQRYFGGIVTLAILRRVRDV